MDLVITTSSGYWSEERLRYCLRAAEKNLKFNNLFVVGKVPKWLTNYNPIVAEYDTDLLLLAGICTIEDLAEGFVHINDHLFLNAPATLTRKVNLGFMPKGEKEVASMSNTIRFLLENDRPTFDYELLFPVLYEKSKITELFNAVQMFRNYSMRTLYCNYFPQEHEREPNPIREQWSHSDDPQESIVVLGDTALYHPQCKKWLSRVFARPSLYEG